MKLLKYMSVLTLTVMLTVLISRKAYADTVLAAPPAEEAPECAELDQLIGKDLQAHIWQIACGRFPKNEKKAKEYYAALIGLADGESGFSEIAVNDDNTNGSVDRGMWQINSCNIKDLKKEGLISCAEDLYKPLNSVNCADYLYWKHYVKYGFSRRSYDGYLYNDGKEHDNKYTRRVWRLQEHWYEVIWG